MPATSSRSSPATARSATRRAGVAPFALVRYRQAAGPLAHAGAHDRRAPYAALDGVTESPIRSRIAFYFADRPTRE